MALVDEKKVIDISIPDIEKTRFRINGDNDKILELNTSDTNILSRLQKGYKELLKLAEAVGNLSTDDDSDPIEDDKLAKQLDELDNKMKVQLDYIFDSNVSEVCAGNSSMYTPQNGKFRFEAIIETLGSLYTNSFDKEFAEMQKRMKKHTDKYTSGKH